MLGGVAMSIVATLEAAGEVLSPAVRAAIELLERENVLLREHVAALQARVAELEARLGQHSGNSSCPPSSDPPGAPPRPTPQPRGGKRGAQRGHRGHHRSLGSPERVDHVREHRPVCCRGCGHDLWGASVVGDPVLHQVAELPPMRAEVTEHRLLRLCCPHCRTHTRAELPAGVGASLLSARG
jgi:transposase